MRRSIYFILLAILQGSVDVARFISVPQYQNIKIITVTIYQLLKGANSCDKDMYLSQESIL
jgi:hypothetical protein